MPKLTSIDMRKNPLFMRNQYTKCGCFGFPLVKKQEVDVSDIRLIACSDTRLRDIDINKKCGVHFL